MDKKHVDKTKGARRAPSRDDLRESRQLKQDADVILLMSLDDPEENDGLRWLAVAKNKDGPLGRICLKFDAAHMEVTATDNSKTIKVPELRGAETL